MKPALTFTVYKSRDGWRWRCRARNGRIVAEGGEAYTRGRDARRALERFVDAFMRKRVAVSHISKEP